MSDATRIHSTAIIETGAELGQSVTIGPYCHIGANVILGDNVSLASHVVITGHTAIGTGAVISSAAVLGGMPQDTKYKGEPTRLVVGARAIIREYVTMHVASIGGDGVTVIGDDCMFMVSSHVAHDCKIGNHVIMTNHATLGGHVRLGDYVMVGGLSAVHQHVRVGAYAMIGGMTGVEGDVIPYAMVMGDRARLSGLNVIGLERRGFARDDIMAIRRAYQTLFENNDGNFASRLAQLQQDNTSPHVAGMLDFITTRDKRNLVMAA